MDRVIVHGLEVSCVVGTRPEERTRPQELLVDLEMEADCRRAAASDDLADAVDYEAVAAHVRSLAEGSSFALLEALAEALATAVLKADRRVTAVELRVTKVAAVAGAVAAGVSIRRQRRGCRQ